MYFHSACDQQGDLETGFVAVISVLILWPCEATFASLPFNFCLQCSCKSTCCSTALLHHLPPSNNFDLHGVSANIILFTTPVLNQFKGGVPQAVLLPVTPKDVAGTLLWFSSVVWQGCGANPSSSGDPAAGSSTQVNVAQRLPVGKADSGLVSVRECHRLSVTPACALMTSLVRAYKTLQMF